ncbi:MAG TPA: ThiF family adenylyltransferase [Stellaceae bacterium]|nr:ThiF family adenylyltransferase [Stellaceae bacterium]
MFHELVSRNEDIRRLLEKGYAIAFDDGYLVVRDIPYLDSEKRLQIGAIVTKLTFIDKHRIDRPDDHQIFFCGSHPHGLDGKPIPNLGGGSATLALGRKDVTVQRRFSNKPVSSKPDAGFTNFFDKIESYVTIISGPAQELHGATPLTFRVDEAAVAGSVFKFHDTLTSRAEIGDLVEKLKNDVIAIVGLGGTGAYILDFMVKVPVREIRAFDPDTFHVHTAFRSPGRLEELDLGKTKGEVYRLRYENFRSGLTVQPRFIDAASADAVDGVTLAFVCVDKGSSRSAIFDLLISKKIPFIDVGMGLDRKQGALNGMLRTTHYSVERAAEMRARQLAEMADAPDDLYLTNIQTAEINALNACIAVIKYKQLRGFYVDADVFNHMLFGVGELQTFGESFQ